MAQSLLCFFLFCFVATTFMSSSVISQPPLAASEQEAVYRVLESINSDVPWRKLFPDDLCFSAPHGVVCEYFSDATSPLSDAASDAVIPHITELSFGYVSDYSPNPPCSLKSNLDPLLLSPFSHLRKLFFYKCFTEMRIPFPEFSSFFSQNSSVEELIFVENPALYGSINGKLNHLGSLRRLVLTGSNVSGEITGGLSGLTNLEQISLSRNKFEGEIPGNFFQKLKKLKVLDLSENGFRGKIPESIGNLTCLLKIDLSFNGFSGKIPENFGCLKKLEFMDLCYNHLGNFGVPWFLGEMINLKEVYLSGNFLGGEIPEIWRNLGGISRIGLSSMGLIGRIPRSMAAHLRNVSYLGLDNNNLEGTLPKEFGTLKFVSELNLENNNLGGRIPFSAGFVSKLGKKLKLKGNLDLCIDEDFLFSKASGGIEQLKLCSKSDIPKTALFDVDSSLPRIHVSYVLMLIGFLFFPC